ncbi:MAG: SprB repeat-containing protein, partial [Flavobacteriales bacterium]|nr:SprB repeat-containing protein [Flavobacteriales bacterium]
MIQNYHLTSGMFTGMAKISMTLLLCAALAFSATAQCTLTIDIIGQSACPGNTGAANAIVSGGTGPYTYNWSNGGSTQSITNLAVGTYTVNVTSANGCIGSQTVTISNTIINPDAGPDVTICAGQSTQLNATGGTIYSWSPSTGLNNPNIPNPVATPASTTAYSVTVGVSSGELVTNGAFSLGNTGFTSEYAYVSAPYVTGDPTTGLFPEATYAVVPNPSIYHSAFNFSPDDHTTGSGNFMAVNGARPDQNVVTVWKQIVNVIPNTTYYFSTWVTSIHPTSPATLNFSINGSTIGSNITAPAPGLWVQFYTIWNSGSNTVANIQIVDLNPDAGGNDFGLDDISFTTICNSDGTDQVVVTVSPVITNNTLTCATPNSNCLNLNPGNIVGSTPAGGNGTYSYQWQVSSDNSAWVNIASANGQSYDPPTITTTTYYRRVVTSGGCSSISSSCGYTIGTAIGSNTISPPSPSAFCVSGDPGNISGSTPTGGGSGSFSYQWQSSTNNITWSNIVGANSSGYNPSTIGQTTYYRRIVTKNSCSSNTSNTVVITINPLPTPTITANGSLSLCTGGNVTLSSSYLTGNHWNPGNQTSNNIYVASAGNYTTTVTDANGCTATSPAVTVSIAAAPSLTCSKTNVSCPEGSNGAVSVSASGGVTPYTYNWSTGATTQSVTGLLAGTYSVVVNQAGCSSTCSVTIPVGVDSQNPTITCPATANITTDAGICTSSASIGTATSSDNCGVQSTTVSNSGPYTVGTTTVTWTATDVNGNTKTCTQDVVVTDGQDPTITCPATANITTDAGICTSSASIGTATSSDNCGVQSTTVSNSGPYSVGTTTVTWTATDVNGNTATCTQDVVVTDGQNPTITCPATSNITTDAGICTSSASIGTATSSDNCGVQSTTVSNSGPYSVGTTTVTWTATDVNGNTKTCTQDVVVTDDEDPSITCPATANIITDAGICTSSASIGTATSSDNCGVQSTTVSNSGPYSVGTTTVTWTATDASGNTATCTQDVVVTDGQDPTITCPATANITTDAGICTSSASIGTATSADNCGVQSTTVSNSGPYSVGTTTVTWTATDASGNTATCTQDVVVTDGQDPTITCPATANITTDAGICTSSASIGTATSADNCGVQSTLVDNSGPY